MAGVWSLAVNKVYLTNSRKTTTSQSVIMRDLISLLNITSHFLLSKLVLVNLFYWDSNRVAGRCYFITVLYFIYNSSGHLELE